MVITACTLLMVSCGGNSNTETANDKPEESQEQTIANEKDDSRAELDEYYSIAENALFSGNYDKANEYLEKISMTEDNNEVYNETRYRWATELVCYGDNVDYTRNMYAMSFFADMPGYKDADEYAAHIYPVLNKETGNRAYAYIYDEYGHVINIYNNYSDAPSTPEYTYDENGRIVAEVEVDYTGTTTENTYVRDDQGRILEIDTKATKDGELIRETVHEQSYETDDEGRVIKKTVTSDGEMSSTSEYSYSTENDCEIVHITEDLPVNDYTVTKRYTLEYDQNHNLVSDHFRSSNNDDITQYDYSYVWMPKHNPNEELYQDFYFQKRFF